MRRVLIVDDSISVARQLKKIVTGSGEFQTCGHARNGLEALKMHQNEKPDVILMDMNMPQMDGLTTLRHLVSLDPQVKVIMVTSLAGVGDKYTEALRLGACNVISKPFEAESVLNTLRAL